MKPTIKFHVYEPVSASFVQQVPFHKQIKGEA